ncbi:MAG: hypothetical protein V1662_02930 [Candidatus Omnitrophota bacterium]
MLRLAGKGQVTFEYVIIIGLVAVALTMMQVYLRRGVQAGIKMATDEIGMQEDYVELEIRKGFLDHSSTTQLTPEGIPIEQKITYQGDGMQTTTLNKELQGYGDSKYIVESHQLKEESNGQ